MSEQALHEGAWQITLGGRELLLRPFSMNDYLAMEREQLAQRMTEEEWRKFMPAHYELFILWRAALHHQPDLTLEDLAELYERHNRTDAMSLQEWTALLVRCLGGPSGEKRVADAAGATAPSSP